MRLVPNSQGIDALSLDFAADRDIQDGFVSLVITPSLLAQKMVPLDVAMLFQQLLWLIPVRKLLLILLPSPVPLLLHLRQLPFPVEPLPL